MSPYGAALGLDQLDEWMEVRFGAADGAPIYWHATGLVRDVLTGEALYTFEYYDVSQQIQDPERPDVKIGVVRKFDYFRDKDTNTVLETMNGQSVGQVLYPYQMFEYAREEERLVSAVVQGTGDHVRRIPSAGDVFRKQDASMVQYTAPSHFPFFHPDNPTFDDFFTITVQYVTMPHQSETQPLHTWGTSIVSRRPPWAGGDGKTLVTAVLSGGGYAKFDHLPAHVKAHIHDEMPAWEYPPRDLGEVARMQTDPSYLFG